MAAEQKPPLQDPFTVILYPLNTEKAVRKMEAENMLIFVVTRNATKTAVKKAVEKAFNAKVDAVNTVVMKDGRKKAYVKLNAATPAVEITTQLGLT